MPRRSRLQLPGTPLHVTQRGVNRCAIFIDDDDCHHGHDLLCEFMARHLVEVHAYVFMGNHLHLLLTPQEPDALAAAMRNFGQCYVQAFNRRHRRSGTLWQGRFKSCLVDTDRYLMAVYRYIELNPVRAAMVALPEQHRWSSVHANLGLREDRLITPHATFLALGTDRQTRAAAYRAWLRDSVDDHELSRLRAHLEQERALGDRTFQAMVEKALGRSVQLRQRGRPPRTATPREDS